MISAACRKSWILVLTASLGSGCTPAEEAAAPAAAPTQPQVLSRTVDLGPLRIEGVQHSMEGNSHRIGVDPTGIGWITGMRTQVIDAETEEPLGEEFFCHSQIQLATRARLLVAATGINRVDLPEGYGIPLAQILADLDEPWRQVSLFGMVLNNHEPDLVRDVKLRFGVDFIAVNDPAAAQVKSLYRASITVLPEEGRDFTVLAGDPPVEVELPPHAHGKVGHWMVPPGRQTIRQRYAPGLFPGTSSVHYGVVHLHNFARSMKLTDLTDGVVLWETNVQHEAERPQIATIPVYSSTEGFLIHADHEYEIESVYDNTSSETVDAMAVMYLYHHPTEGQTLTYPAPAGLAPPGAAAPPVAGGGHH